MNINHRLKRFTAGALVPGAVAAAMLALGTGTAHAGAYRWCPGDPLPHGYVAVPNGRTQIVPINPAWDTNVCHDYITNGNHVQEGIPCISLICPPGTMRQNQMTDVPNVGEG